MISSCDGIAVLVRNTASTSVALQEQAVATLDQAARWGATQRLACALTVTVCDVRG
jgi:hypothetical protein